MMLAVTLVSALILVLACYDVANCVACYRAANRATQAVPETEAAGPAPRQLSPDRLALRHSFLFLLQKANYYWQIITTPLHLARLYLAPRRTGDTDVALHLINTSLVTWANLSPLGDKALLVTLDFEGFAFPYLRDRRDNRLVIECELRLLDPAVARERGARVPAPTPVYDHAPFEARTLRFELNGTPIRSPVEQLSILAIMVSCITHPVIHSFGNQVYESHAHPTLRPFDDLFLHAQYLNWCAWYWPGVMFRIPGARGHYWFKETLEHNARLPLPRGHAAKLVPLAPYSRFVRYILATRPVLVRLCQQHGLPLSSEALFICTILHATDHVNCDAYTRGHLLRHEQLPNSGLFNAIALMFYRPSQHFWTNLLRDKREKTAFYRELYAEISKLDPQLTDQVTLSISY